MADPAGKAEVPRTIEELASTEELLDLPPPAKGTYEEAVREAEPILQVVDFSLKDAVSPKIVATERRDIRACLDFTLTQTPDVCRVYLERWMDTDPDFRELVEQYVSQKFHDWYRRPKLASTSFAEALSQCQGDIQGRGWWAVDFTPTYARMISFEDGSTESHRTSHWTLYVRFIRDPESPMIAFLSCDMPRWTRATIAVKVLQEIVQKMGELEAKYKFIGKNDALAKGEYKWELFLLRICHALLLLQCQTTDDIRSDYHEVLDGLAHMNRYITSTFLETVSTMSRQVERLNDEVPAIAATIEGLLDVLASTFGPDCDALRQLDTELRSVCRKLSATTSSLAPRLENRLKFVEISRNLQESASLWLLSLLASIFLPLSLASSLLSMQTRLAKLHYLLYDFCGVVVFFGTLTLLSVLIMRWFARNQGSVHGIFHVTKSTHYFFILSEWMLIFSSFFVGMLRDVILGLKVLGYGTAGVLVLTALLVSFLRVRHRIKRCFVGYYGRAHALVRRWNIKFRATEVRFPDPSP